MITFIFEVLIVFGTIGTIHLAIRNRQLSKFTKALRGYMNFKFYFPANVEPEVAIGYLHKLSYYDAPVTVPDDKKLEFVVARVRLIGFPEGAIVEYKGKKVKI